MSSLEDLVGRLRGFYNEIRMTNVRSRGLKVETHEVWCQMLEAIVQAFEAEVDVVGAMEENIKFLRTQIGQPKKVGKKKEDIEKVESESTIL